MPGKSRRVASRQAQLSRKRKRAQKEPADTILAAPLPREVDGRQAEAPPAEAPETPPTTPPEAPARPSPVAHRPAPVAAAAPVRRTSRIRGESPAVSNFIGAEVRRILLMASGVLAVIIVLGILL